MVKRKIQFRHFIFLVIIFFAATSRMYGIRWGLPHHFHSDEDVMMHWALGISHLDQISKLVNHPYFFVYGPVPLYWTAAGHRFLSYCNPEIIGTAAEITSIYSWARFFSASTGILTCWIIYRTGLSIGNPLIGIFAVSWLAFMPVHIQNCHFFTAEIPLTFFAAASLCLVLGKRKPLPPSSSITAGILYALALLCKYTAGALLPAIILALLPADRQSLSRGMISRRFIIPVMFFCLSCALVFGMGNFWIFLNPGNFLSTLNMLNRWNTGAEQPLWLAHFQGLTPGLFWITDLIPHGMGYPVMIAFFAGFLRTIRTRSVSWTSILAASAGLFILTGFSFMQYIRYIVPLAPFIALTAGYGLEWIWVLVSQKGRMLKITGCALILWMLGFSALRAAATASIYHFPDTRIEAACYILEHVTPESVLLLDNSAYRPPVGPELFEPDIGRNLVLRGSPWMEKKLPPTLRVLDVYNYLYNPKNTPLQKTEYIKDRLTGTDWIVFGEEAIVQYRAIRKTHPEVNRFYDELFEGKLPFQLCATIERLPGICGYQWDDREAELTWRLFDHPRIFIFKRMGEAES